LNGVENLITQGIQAEKLFDVLAEGLLSENSRGDRTPLELFLFGVRGWEAGSRRILVEEPNGDRP